MTFVKLSGEKVDCCGLVSSLTGFISFTLYCVCYRVILLSIRQLVTMVTMSDILAQERFINAGDVNMFFCLTIETWEPRLHV